MANYIRYADVERAMGAGRRQISLDALSPTLVRDAEGHILPVKHEKITLSASDSLKILKPYFSVRFMEQFKALAPLAAYLALFQILFLRHLVEESWVITGGLFAVIVGLMFFMEGLKLGLMPFATIIGGTLPRKSPLPLVLIVTLLLGIGVTFAEPAIGALKAAGQNVIVERAPYLYALLNNYSDQLVLMVGFSVGAAAVIGTLRFLYGWSLKPVIYFTLVPVLGVSLYCAMDPELTKVLGLAWDAGAVTTGPVTVPLVLSLGIGIAAAAGKGSNQLSGFGIVTLASLFPIFGVLCLLIYVTLTTSPAEIIEAAKALSSANVAAPAWYESSPGEEIILGIRAILPLVIFLLFILKIVLRESLKNQAEIFLGIGLTIVGMCIFNAGLTYGLSKLGGATGSLVPIAFMKIDGIEISPIYVYAVGLTLALAFAWFLGFGATIAEPALNALGLTAESLTNGAFKKKTLIYAVSTGVAFGIAIGLAKLIFNLPLIWLIIPGYALASLLTILSSEEFVNIAWDSAGVTTGPITVPLVLAMGLGIGNATGAVEGFGILSMASIGPIISVMLTGLWARYKVKAQLKTHKRTSSTLDQEVGATI